MAQEKKCSSEQSNDLEIFLQSFEKPTQIYRFLMYRNKISPLFLQRTLSYMNFKRKSQKRKVADLILRQHEVDKKQQHPPQGLNNRNKKIIEEDKCLKITFSGVYDEEDPSISTVDLDVSLVYTHSKRSKLCKRKTQVKFIDRLNLKKFGSCTNSDDLSNPSNNTHVSIPYNLLRKSLDNSTTTPLNHSYESTILSFRVSYSTNYNEDPPKKRLKQSTNQNRDPSLQSNQLTNSDSRQKFKEFYAEMVVYKSDTAPVLLLIEGSYELLLQDSNLKKDLISEDAVWQAVSDDKISKYSIKEPKILFKVEWVESSSANHMTSSNLAPPYNPPTQSVLLSNGINSNYVKKAGPINMEQNEGGYKNKGNTKLFYQFILNNRVRQQTEAKHGFVCPWCSLNCRQIKPLMCHLKFCHARFHFVYTESAIGGRIDVTIDDGYDGSYEGHAHLFNNADVNRIVGDDVRGGGGVNNWRGAKPMKRMNVTEILVCRSRKATANQSLDGNHGTKHLIHGHTRVYYHTATCQPIDPKYIDIDSEGETDPLWLRQKTKQMIDDFMDVNEGEKEVMKLWNLYVMHNNYTGDCQMAVACYDFINLHAEYFKKNNLSNNLILHFANLFDFGLISSREFASIVAKFVNFQRGLNSASSS